MLYFNADLQLRASKYWCSWMNVINVHNCYIAHFHISADNAWISNWRRKWINCQHKTIEILFSYVIKELLLMNIGTCCVWIFPHKFVNFSNPTQPIFTRISLITLLFYFQNYMGTQGFVVMTTFDCGFTLLFCII